MTSIHYFTRRGWLALFLLLPFLAAAADQAKLPYEMIYQIQEKAASVAQTYTNLHIFLRVRSTLPDVKNSDLHLYIDAKTGPILVTLDSDGRFILPMLPRLLEEKPPIVVNQPKGTMEFGWFVGLLLDHVPTNGIRYNDALQPLKDVEVIRGQMLPGSSTFSIRGLKFIYPADSPAAAVTIRAKSGDRVFKTDATHTLVIPWEPALQQENPILAIPVPPEKIDVANAPEK
jgi:hypothetical protein